GAWEIGNNGCEPFARRRRGGDPADAAALAGGGAQRSARASRQARGARPCPGAADAAHRTLGLVWPLELSAPPVGDRGSYATATERRGGGHGADHVLGAQRHGKTGIRRAPAQPDEPRGTPCLSAPQGTRAQN